MRWPILFALGSFGLLLVLSQPLQACINDREVRISEKEFKSSYQDNQDSEDPGEKDYSPEEPGQLLAVAITAFGSVMLAGAVFLTLVKRPPPV
jgi:hypothetical protein